MAGESKVLGGDERLKKNSGEAVRGDRESADFVRENHDGTATNVAERRFNFRDEWSASALPQPPEIPGYHLCWLSTTNSYDPIHKRMRIGYVPVKIEEVPGFEHYKMKSGEYEGMVSVNEMVLFKIPMEVYQEMMAYFHHEKPIEDEEMLKQNQAMIDEQARRVAEKDDDGFNTLGVQRAPKFH